MVLKSLSGLLLVALATCSQAGVVINGTRVIYRQADGEAVVQLRNTDSGPLLVQAWIDDGDVRAKVESLDMPFTLVPSVARIDPSRGQAIRILQTRNDLPVDRESLLWLNVLEIPPKPSRMLAEGQNLLQLSFRSRIKLFYRPKELESSPEDALKQLRFAIGRNADGEPEVVVYNPSPYHVTFRSLTLREDRDGPVVAALDDGASERMVGPVGELSVPLRWKSGTPVSTANVQVFFTAINDQGGDTRLQQGARR
ncbi:fimbria/pilus periplasmic chaperone [Pseudomonas aeruginosa]|uniref:fimbria/pilus periplasmic chaperone n=1 Tax=Pseudomonas aeruginosa TaxID=287 RepID=UPI000BB56B6D|nr:fimbria/pilus periplasmic chaperone [Pseudomonas aeruginosa]MBH3992627.1 fimbria/pilus periplasmic chaperone [Pseudomonas aeruginosa]MBH4138077.1 fimbria/pilus periplasmic chaperone [Pseudomonas aeruginosa]MDG9821941.1 fimbria/pilus periplasmic chaperone [Pseudomonas aeruginosa]MDG9936470.1 fimbria/pilus periplasmic chaperone [Pseudomonas aeruginosa]MDH0528156.1 fimbria/pilus periplasmic chaperone [Pseudomonas aeruginosa]